MNTEQCQWIRDTLQNLVDENGPQGYARYYGLCMAVKMIHQEDKCHGSAVTWTASGRRSLFAALRDLWVDAGYPDDPYPVRAKGWGEMQAERQFHIATDVGMWSKKGFYGRARWAMIHAMIAQCDKRLKEQA